MTHKTLSKFVSKPTFMQYFGPVIIHTTPYTTLLIYTFSVLGFYIGEHTARTVSKLSFMQPLVDENFIRSFIFTALIFTFWRFVSFGEPTARTVAKPSFMQPMVDENVIRLLIFTLFIGHCFGEPTTRIVAKLSFMQPLVDENKIRFLCNYLFDCVNGDPTARTVVNHSFMQPMVDEKIFHFVLVSLFLLSMAFIIYRTVDFLYPLPPSFVLAVDRLSNLSFAMLFFISAYSIYAKPTMCVASYSPSFCSPLLAGVWLSGLVYYTFTIVIQPILIFMAPGVMPLANIARVWPTIRPYYVFIPESNNKAEKFSIWEATSFLLFIYHLIRVCQAIDLALPKEQRKMICNNIILTFYRTWMYGIERFRMVWPVYNPMNNWVIKFWPFRPKERRYEPQSGTYIEPQGRNKNRTKGNHKSNKGKHAIGKTLALDLSDHVSMFANILSSPNPSEPKRSKYSLNQFVSKLKSDINLARDSGYMGFQLFEDGKFKHSMDTVMSDTDLAPFLPTWANRMTFLGLRPMLQSLLHHGMESQTQHPYTKYRANVVNYALENWCRSTLDIIGSIVLIDILTESNVTINQPDPVPGHDYKPTRDFNLDGYVVPSVTQGEPNFLVQLLDMPTTATTKSRLTGTFKSVMEKNGSITQALEEIRSLFPPLASIVEPKKGKTFTVALKPKARRIWFLEHLPPSYFYMEHSLGPHALFQALNNATRSLQARLEAYATRYLQVHKMLAPERSMLKQARTEKFKQILRSSLCQSMFASGMSKQEVVDYVYKNYATELAPDNLGDVMDHVYTRQKSDRCKSIAKSRADKYRFVEEFYEPESSTVIYLTAFGCFSLLCATIFQFYSVLVRLVSDLRDRLFGKVDEVANTVNTAIRSWNPTQILSINRYERPEAVLLLIEFKVIVHMLYEWNFGDMNSFLSHASYLGVTRAQDVISLISHLPRPGVEPETFDISSLYDAISSILNATGVSSYSDTDLKRTILELNFIKSKTGFIKAKAQYMMEILRLLCRTLFSYDPCDPNLNEFSHKMLDVVSSTRRYSLDPPTQLDQHEILLRLYESACELSTNQMMARQPKFFTDIFNKSFRTLEEMASDSSNAIRGDKDRVEPVFVMFSGKPKSGKTTAMETLARKFAAKRNQGIRSVFSYNLESKFFEGYHNQQVVFMDDVFVYADADDRAKTVMHIISMVNTSPYLLDMAFSLKGKRFFNSPFIVGSTNAMGPNVRFEANITSQDALDRRIHLHVHRDEPGVGPDDQFLVCNCAAFPILRGKRLTATQIANVALRIQDLHAANRAAIRNTPVDMSDYVPYLDPLPPLVGNLIVDEEEEGEDDGMEPQMKSETYTNPTAYIRLFFEVFETPQWWKQNWISVIVILFLTITSGAAFYKFFFGSSTNVQSHDERNIGTGRGGVRVKSVRKAKHLEKITGGFRIQSESNRGSVGTLHDSVVQFIAHYNLSGASGSTTCMAIHIEDSIYMYPAHFHNDFAKAELTCFTVVTNHGSYDVDYAESQMIMFKGMDAMFCKLPTDGFKPREGKQYFVNTEGPSVLNSLSVGMCVQLVGRTEEDKFVKPAILKPTERSINYRSGEQITIHQPVRYAADTRSGDSGCAVVYTAPNNKSYIIGMHVGKLTVNASESIGLATPWSLGMIEEAIAALYDDTITVQSGIDFPFIVHDTLLQGNPMPSRSKISPSSLMDYRLPCTTIPAKLAPFYHNGVRIDPRIVSISAQVQEPITIRQYPVYVGHDYLMSQYPPHDKYRTILTWDQAINGVPELYYPPIDGTTSAGYPYNLSATKGKAPYVTYDGTTHIYDPAFLKSMMDMDAQLHLGVSPTVIWTDVLKDETRPIAKALAGKTRLIATSPLHFTLLVRRYFGSFIAYVHSFSVTKFVSVGINPHSNDWKHLYNRFKYPKFLKKPHEVDDYESYFRSNASIISGDFSKWDKRAPVSVGKVFVEYVNKWYNDGNDKVRLLLWEKMSYQLRLFANYLYIIPNGNPSGNSITSEYNSFIQVLCWLPILMEDFKLKTSEFDIATYGDDCLVVINRPNVTTTDLAPFWLDRYNLEFTHSSKESVTIYESMDTVTYLGRSFKPFNFANTDVILAPLSKQTIYEIMYWTRGVENETIISSFASFLHEMSHYTPEEYSMELTLLLQAIEDRCEPVVSIAVKHIMDGNTYYDLFLQKYYRGGIPLYASKPCTGQNPVIQSYNPESFDSTIVHEEYTPQSGKPPMAVTTDNTDFTTRAAKEVTDTQQVELGSYQDAAPIVSTSTNSEAIMDPYKNVNMETFTLSEVLNREYPVASYSWTSAMAHPWVFGNLNMPDALFAVPFLAAKLDGFRNFKAGIRISIRISSSAFNYGRFMVSYIPDPTNDTFYAVRTATAYSTSGFPHILVSASSSEVAVLDVPFIYPERAIDRADTLPVASLGRFRFTVVNPLTNINGIATTVTVFVTAQFINAEIYLPYTATSGKRVHASREAIQKSKEGVISSVLESSSTFASALSTVPIVSDYANLYAGIAGAASRVAKVMGLDKPTSLSRTQVGKINPYSDIGNSRGVDTSVKLSVDPENAISTVPNVAGVSTDECLIKYIAGTPTLRWILTFGSTDPINTVKEIANTDITTLDYSYAQFLGVLTKYYSGSMKVKVYISASNMHAVRIVFFLNKQATNWQQCYHRVIDVQGDTCVEFTLPYCATELAIKQEASPTYLYAQLLSYSQPQTAVNTPIYMNVYVAMASDFRIYVPHDVVILADATVGLVEAPYEPESNPRLDFQQDFEPIHPSVSGYDHSGYIVGEEITSYRDFIHRYYPLFQADPNFNFPVYNGPGTITLFGYTGLEMFGLIFRYHRGSIRFKILQRDDVKRSANLYFAGSTTPDLAGFTMSCSVNPLIEFEAPYYSNLLYEDNCDASELRVQLAGPIDSDDVYVVKAGGDDFSFHFLVPPPPIEFPGTNQGMNGLRLWLQNPPS